jgi:hypothetical protein
MEKQFMIFNTNELSLIDFTQVMETSIETVRKSVDGTKVFVKWVGEIPSSLSTLTTKEGPYSHSQILEILSTEEWTSSTNGLE